MSESKYITNAKGPPADMSHAVDAMRAIVEKAVVSSISSAGSAFSAYTAPPPPHPHIESVTFMDRWGSPTGAYVYGWNVRDGSSVGSYKIELLVDRTPPPEPPVPTPPTHDMTPVALELANLLQAERLMVKELKRVIERQDDAMGELLKEKTGLIHSMEDLQAATDRMRVELSNVGDDNARLEDKVNELLLENETLGDIADSKGREASDLRDKVYELNDKILALEVVIERLRDE